MTMNTWDRNRRFTHGHQIFHGAIWVVETGSHGSLNFLARETHINNVVDRGRERGTAQETGTRTTRCRGLDRLFCCRLSRLRNGIGGSGLSWLSQLSWLSWLSWLDRLRRG